MYQYNQNKKIGLGRWPEFKKEIDFYVPVGTILIELKDCSVTGIEPQDLVHDETNFEHKKNYAIVVGVGFLQ